MDDKLEPVLIPGNVWVQQEVDRGQG